ncbi:MAG: hypothetical protein EXR79_10030 [Myxococcales bacterium]|nr:hypothetical protein [Myxococcales bacterium]
MVSPFRSGKWAVGGLVLLALARASAAQAAAGGTPPAIEAPATGSTKGALKTSPRPAPSAADAGHSDAKAGKGTGQDRAEKPDKTSKSDAPPPDLPLTPVGEDALRLGPFAAPPRPFPFPLLGDDKVREVFVDRAGNLYKERPYAGVIPDWTSAAPQNQGQRCKVEVQPLTWVGFQNSADGSRVFVQVEKDACGYVYRPNDAHIVIDLPMVTVPNANLKREILTGAFPTAIEQIKTEEVPGRGARVVIVLKDRRPYLSAQLGRFLFVDVPR